MRANITAYSAAVAVAEQGDTPKERIERSGR